MPPKTYLLPMLTLEPNIPFDPEVIRKLVKDDGDLKLMFPTARLPFAPEQWSEKFESRASEFSFLAQVNGEIVGHLALLRMDRLNSEVTLGMVYLTPEYRGRGLASVMILEAELLAAEFFKIRTMTLRVREWNTQALKVYSRLGYLEIERNQDLIVMQKDLHLRAWDGFANLGRSSVSLLSEQA